MKFVKDMKRVHLRSRLQFFSLHVPHGQGSCDSKKQNGREAEASRPFACLACLAEAFGEGGNYQLMRHTIWPMRPPGSNVVLMSVYAVVTRKMFAPSPGFSWWLKF